MLALAVGIVLIVLYPMWPYELKLGAYYVIFSLLMIMIGIIIVRYVVWIACFICGWSFWIFPNFFDDSKGLIGSFIPFLEYGYRKDGWTMFVFRIMFGVFLAFGTYHWFTTGFDPEELQSMIIDSFDWGKDKIVGNNTNALQVKGGHGKYSNIDDIIRMTEEQEAREEAFKQAEEEEKKA